MQKRIIHNLLSRKWLILLCFMLLPTILEASDLTDNMTSFYHQVKILAYKKISKTENLTRYAGAKLQLANGAIVELDNYSSYDAFQYQQTKWGYIEFFGISAARPGTMKISWNGSDKYAIRMFCKKATESGYIKEETSNVSHYFSTTEDLYLSWTLSQPSTTFTTSNIVEISAIDIFPIYDDEGLEYKFDMKKEKWTLYKANTASDSVSIKSNIDYNGSSYPVTSISNYAFGNLKTIKKIHIPSSINHIDNNAFSGCDNIECVYIDDISSWCKIDFENKESNPLWSGSKLYVGTHEVNEIEYDETFDNIKKYAFTGCLSLKKLTLGSNIKSIGDYAFDGCVNLKTVYSYNPTPINYGKVPFSSTTYEGTLYVPRNGVVRHCNDGTFVLLQVLLQPVDALRIQVVGRLVEQKHIGLLQQQAAQGHAAAFTSREVLHRLVVGRTAQGIHRPLQLAVEVPCIRGVNDVLQLCLTGKEGIHLLRIFVVLGQAELIVDFLVLGQRVDHFLYALHHDFFHRLVGIELWLLSQVTDGIARRENHLALVVLVQSGNDFHQCGLTGTVETDDTNLGTIEKGQVDVFQYLLVVLEGFAYSHHRKDNLLVVCHIYVIKLLEELSFQVVGVSTCRTK